MEIPTAGLKSNLATSYNLWEFGIPATSKPSSHILDINIKERCQCLWIQSNILLGVTSAKDDEVYNIVNDSEQVLLAIPSSWLLTF